MLVEGQSVRRELKRKVSEAHRNIYVKLLIHSVLSGIVIVLFSGALTLFSRVVERPVPEANMLRLVYTHTGMIVAIVGMVCSYLAIFVNLRLNESIKIQEFNSKYGEEKALEAIRCVAGIRECWNEMANPTTTMNNCAKPDFLERNPSNNSPKRIVIKNLSHFVKKAEGSERVEERHFPWTEAQDSARRLLKNYFLSAYQLYRDRSVSKDAFLDICSKDAIVLLFDIVEPMEAIINENYSYEPFYEIMRALGNSYEKLKKGAKAHTGRRYYLPPMPKPVETVEMGSEGI